MDENRSRLPRYVIISPVRNEAQYIQQTIESVVGQTILPAVWVIVNDGSTDNTEAIIRQYAENYSWIKLVNRQDRGLRQRGKGVVEAFYDGLECIDQDYTFIVKLDGDVSFGAGYFEYLLGEFLADPQLGIAGGAVYERPDGKTWKLWAAEHHVRGPTKVYRKGCFDAIGGLTPSLGWDGVDEWKALYLGWKVHTFLEVKIYHFRPTGAAGGSVHHRVEQGYAAYRMGYHPLYLIARGSWHMLHRPYGIGGLAMIGAYLLAWLQKQDKIADPDVSRFIRQAQMKALSGRMIRRPEHKPELTISD